MELISCPPSHAQCMGLLSIHQTAYNAYPENFRKKPLGNSELILFHYGRTKPNRN
jgi:hypothetical protein